MYRQGNDAKGLAKILLLGDSAVGKSSLVLRFCDDSFESSFILTIGVDFRKKCVECDGKKINLQIWDTAGQERFRTISPAYFRSAMAVILVYDVTNVESFLNIRYWMKNVEDYGNREVVKMVVGNKVDLTMTSPDLRQVRKQRGRDMALEYDVPFFETSAKTGLNVEEAFQMISRLILHRRQPTSSPPWPPLHSPSTAASYFSPSPSTERSHHRAEGREEEEKPTPFSLHQDEKRSSPAADENRKFSQRRCCGGV